MSEAAVRPTEVKSEYQRCLDARRQWMSVRGRTTQANLREKAHADLHEAVLGWFEVLVPFISERPGEVKQLWESAPLYPVEPVQEKVLVCGNDTVFDLSDDGPDPSDLCPRCSTPLEPTTRHKTDDEGRGLYWWKQGLKHLSSWSHDTVEVEQDAGELSGETKIIEKPNRLPPEILMRAARYLDLAAEECGLLAETDRALPTGEL